MDRKHEVASGSQSLRAKSRLYVPHRNLTYPHKKHYWIVFEEKGVTIDITSFRDIMKTLTATATGVSFSPDYSLNGPAT